MRSPLPPPPHPPSFAVLARAFIADPSLPNRSFLSFLAGRGWCPRAPSPTPHPKKARAKGWRHESPGRAGRCWHLRPTLSVYFYVLVLFPLSLCICACAGRGFGLLLFSGRALAAGAAVWPPGPRRDFGGARASSCAPHPWAPVRAHRGSGQEREKKWPGRRASPPCARQPSDSRGEREGRAARACPPPSPGADARTQGEKEKRKKQQTNNEGATRLRGRSRPPRPRLSGGGGGARAFARLRVNDGASLFARAACVDWTEIGSRRMAPVGVRAFFCRTHTVHTSASAHARPGGAPPPTRSRPHTWRPWAAPVNPPPSTNL